MHATRPIYTTKPQAMYCGPGAADVCVPTSWSDRQAIEFGEQCGSGSQLRVTSVVRVPCDCRPGFVHIQLGGK